MKHFASLVLIASISTLSAGCGGGTSAACGTSPCGGDITGRWNVTDVCLDKSRLMTKFVGLLMGACPGAAIASFDAGPTGEYVFNTDSTYKIDMTMTISVGISMPLSCFPSYKTCAEVDGAIKMAAAGDPSAAAASCTGSGPCVCTLTEPPQQVMEAGTYSVSGSTLLTTPTGQATPDSSSYCAKGSTLMFKDSTPDAKNPVIAIIGTRS